MLSDGTEDNADGSSVSSARTATPSARTRARTRNHNQTQTRVASQPNSPDPDNSPSPQNNSAAPSSDDDTSAPTGITQIDCGIKIFLCTSLIQPGKRRRSSGVRQLESTLNPFTPPVDRPSREQRKLQALVKTFEKLEHREKRKKDEGSGSFDRRWKRKKSKSPFFFSFFFLSLYPPPPPPEK